MNIKLNAATRLRAAEKKPKPAPKPKTKKPNTTRSQDKWLRMQKLRTD